MTKPETLITRRKVQVARRSFEHATLFRHWSLIIGHFALAVSLLIPLWVRAQSAPSAKDILGSVRMMESQQQLDLQGQLRQDNLVVPFRLVQNGPLIRYSFANPDEVLQLRLGENSSRLDLVAGGGSHQFGASKLKQKIRGTCVTYEDLAFKFLYWPTARVLGEENVRTRNCWKLQLRAPSRESQYSNVLLWIDKASGALMRMEGYDWNAQLAKRFEVISAQKIEGRWFLKQMRVEDLQPGTNHVLSRTYLEIKK
ncbi:MAG TPA: outer membrane lipoprotein-sorting protein [Candidatus Udaeobacter sp.]|nr:outer membrane lipoprotein-sorting protein [Candidatus Udaeobacter sp.]